MQQLQIELIDLTSLPLRLLDVLRDLQQLAAAARGQRRVEAGGQQRHPCVGDAARLFRTVKRRAQLRVPGYVGRNRFDLFAEVGESLLQIAELLLDRGKRDFDGVSRGRPLGRAAPVAAEDPDEEGATGREPQALQELALRAVNSPGSWMDAGLAPNPPSKSDVRSE